MKHRSDIDRVLQVWMADGPSAIPDRVVDVVAARIGVQRQRRAWPFQRRTTMIPLKIAVGLAAALVIAVVGYNLLPRQSSFGGESPMPSPTATPTPIPTSTPVATGPVALPGGTLTAGRYRFQPVPSLSAVADIPSGWHGVPPWAVTGPTTDTEPPGGIGVALVAADGLFSDPCHWDVDGTGTLGQAGDVTVGPTVDDLVAALRSNTSYTSSTATPLTIDGFAGQELEIQLPSDVDFATCDKDDASEGRYFVFSGIHGGLYAQGPGNRWHLFILDVEGTRLIIVVPHYADTPQADLDAAQAIVESFEFTP